MPNFNSTLTSQIINTDGSKLIRSKQITSNAKVIFDDVLPAGALDLEPILATISNPQMILVVAQDGEEGFTVNIDNLGATTLKMQTLQLEMDGTAQAVDIVLTTTQEQRIQIYALGDPDVPAS